MSLKQFLPSDEAPLLPTLVDQLAQEAPERVFCLSPKGTHYADGIVSVTMPDLARAIDRAAHWLDETLGKSSNFETIAYMGPNDARYHILIIAAMKTGYKLMLPSLRNSVVNQLHLLDKTSWKALLHAHSTSVESVTKERSGLKAVEVPELSWFLRPEAVKTYLFTKTYAEAKDEPALVLHSSGSTGPPKPIIWTYSSIETVRSHFIPDVDDPQWKPWMQSLALNDLCFCPMPFYHAVGMLCTLLENLLGGNTYVHPPADVATSTSVVKDVTDHFKLGWAVLPPSLLEDMAQLDSTLEIVDKIPKMSFAGGPLAEGAGAILANHTFLISVMGSTESGVYPHAAPEFSEDFAWLRIKPDNPEIEFHDRGEGQYELVMVKNPKLKFRRLAAFDTFPHDDEYATKDLFIKHPKREGLWKHVARTDDVILLSNGEKVVPIPMEGILHEAPELDAVLVLGHGHFQVAALVEPTDEARKLGDKELMKRLMPYIRKSNSAVPGFARLAPDRVIITSPDKPMIRTAKGSIIRKATLAMYDQDIEKMYSSETQDDDTFANVPLFATGVETTEKALEQMVSHITSAKDVEIDQDFFAAGVDSLQVISLVRQLKPKVRKEAPSVEVDKIITPGFIYAHPNIKSLAAVLQAVKSGKAETGESQEAGRHRAMEDMLNKYSQDFPDGEKKIVVLLTGTTGSLGAYLLDELIQRERIHHVFALNRAEDGLVKQTENNTSRGLSTDFHDKVTFHHADLSQERLGLDLSAYDALRDAVTFIIHNAWPVNFNQSLASFEPHVQGVRHLIDFSADSAHRPPILFTSSVATTQNWSGLHPGELAPEKLIGDVRVPAPMGYAESKFVAEHLLARAARRGVSAAICHVGQIAGPAAKPGMWNRAEWFPSLVASSKYLGLVPSAMGTQTTVDWVPVDLMAAILVELCAFDKKTPVPAGAAWTLVHNLVNPTKAPWRTVVRALQRRFTDAKVVDWNDWVAALRKSAEGDKADPVANPGIKLLDFYEGVSKGGEAVPPLETRDTVGRSRTMREMSAVSEEWVTKWIEPLGV